VELAEDQHEKSGRVIALIDSDCIMVCEQPRTSVRENSPASVGLFSF